MITDIVPVVENLKLTATYKLNGEEMVLELNPFYHKFIEANGCKNLEDYCWKLIKNG